MNWYEKVQQKPEIILCAAILRKSERTNIQPYHPGKNDICKIEIGYRHHDIMQRFGNELSKSPYAQGFYTNKGRFVTRCEAMYIAHKAGQVPDEIALKEKDSESFVQFMNDMIIGDLLDDKVDSVSEKYKVIDNQYGKMFNQLFSEDLY